jgi:hypothetical protein
MNQRGKLVFRQMVFGTDEMLTEEPTGDEPIVEDTPAYDPKESAVGFEVDFDGADLFE